MSTAVNRTTSFAGRAVLALALLAGFYLFAIALAFALMYLAYASVVDAHRIHLGMLIGGPLGAFAIVKGLLFARAAPFEAPGPEVVEVEHPRLFASIRRVASAMDTRMPAQVFLVPDVNAFVTETGGFLGFGTTRVMGIGVGLLALDSVSELEATLAHEFGHYVGGDTRLGGIVYRTRVALAAVLANLGPGLIARPFRSYARMFLRVSHAVSRAQELAADRASVALAGREVHVRGLEREARGAFLFAEFVQKEVAPVLEAGFRPTDFYGGFREYVGAVERQGRLPAIDEALRLEATDPFDTHPSLRDRIAYVESVPGPQVHPDDTPAMALLEDLGRTQDRLVVEVAVRVLGAPRALEPIAWGEVASRVHGPVLAKNAAESVDALARAFGVESAPRVALRVLLSAAEEGRLETVAMVLEPGLVRASTEVRASRTPAVARHHLALVLGAVLVDRGGRWTKAFLSPFTVELGDERIQPFELAARALREPEVRAALAAMADAPVGLAALPLVPIRTSPGES